MEEKEMNFIRDVIDLMLERSGDLLTPYHREQLQMMRNKAILNDADYTLYNQCLDIINKGD